MNELASYFPGSYAESRERLLKAVHGLSTRHPVCLDSRALDARGPAGETLALDFTVLGARKPRQALVLSSGTHGVEGYTGAAIQHYVLDRVLPGLSLAADTAVIVQHANNPYGFAWHRRVNENNVDFNRNFPAHFDSTLCDPDYERLHDVLNPADLEPAHEADRRRVIDAYIAEHGLRRFQQAAVGGQYRYPRGIQFGGARREQGAQHLLDLVGEYLSEAHTVVWLDFHTGLGDFAACELVTGAPADSACYALSRQVWPGWVKSATAGESVSTPLNGLLDRGLEAALPGGCRFAFAYPEYGTYEPMRIILAMRSDNWVHQYGDPFDATGRALKAELLEAFRPADLGWQHRIVATGAELVDLAIGWVPGIGRPARVA